MKLINVMLVTLMAALPVLPLTVAASSSVAEAMSEFAWEKRQILLFAPDAQNQNYQDFLATAKEQQAALDERRLQVWHILSGQPVKLDETRYADLSAEDFQTEYAVAADEFSVILIGYDQGEKLRQDTVDLERLFAEIDQMPMRVREMRGQ
jgi:hypothetical protein